MTVLKKYLGVLVLNLFVVACIWIQVNRVDELNKIDTKDYISHQVSYKLENQYA